MSNVSFRTKKDKAELWKQKVTVTSVAVVKKRFLYGTCNFMVDSDVGTGDFLLVLVILHVWAYACTIACVSRHRLGGGGGL